MRPSPAILAAALVLVLAAASVPAADRTLSASGTIVRLDARARTLSVAVAEGVVTDFVWTPDTKIAGTLTPGARVTLRYTAGSDGKNVALQINVSRS